MDKGHIWQVVAAIPAGYVASYGQVARQAGLGRGARQVGAALKGLPAGTRLPWHRVLNARGKIALPVGSRGHALQKRRLQAEGVVFSAAGIVGRTFFLWPQ